MARMRIGRRRSGLPKRNVFFITSVLFFALSLQTFWYIENRIEPVLLDYANLKVKQIATDSINFAISKKIVENDDFSELFIESKDKYDRIQSLTLNVKEASRVQAEATARVREKLEELSEQQIEVPLGVALNSNILATYGPNIPISMVPVGATEVNLIPVMQKTGINVVLITVNLQIKTFVKVVIPFSSEQAEISQDIVISLKVLNGEVPDYYFNSDTGEAVPFQVAPPIVPPTTPSATPPVNGSITPPAIVPPNGPTSNN